MALSIFSINQSHLFFQLSLATKEDRNKTAFITCRGQFRFTRLTGLTYLCCLVFIDDCIIMSCSFDDHLRHVGLVLQRFRQANLKLKPSKCHLFQRRFKFLSILCLARVWRSIQIKSPQFWLGFSPEISRNCANLLGSVTIIVCAVI